MSELSSFNNALKTIVNRLKNVPDSKPAARLRAHSKGCLRNSVANTMDSFRRALEAVPGALEAIQVRSADALSENEASLAPVKGPLRPVWDALDANSKVAIWEALDVMVSASFSAPGPVPLDEAWSSIMTTISGKTLEVSESVGSKLNSLVDLLLGFAKKSMGDGMQQADAEDLDGVDLTHVSEEPAPPSEVEVMLRAFLSHVTSETVSSDLCAADLVAKVPGALESPASKLALNAVHKVCKNMDVTLIEGILSKSLAQIDTASVESLMASARAFDPATVGHELNVLRQSVQKSEVIEAFRTVLVEANPETLKTVLKAAIGTNRQKGGDMIKQLLKSDLVAGVASQLPTILDKDGSINIDRLVEAIKRPRKVPAPPRLSRRR